MEEKKLDPYQLIGFVLIALIMTWMLMRQQKQNLNTQAKVESKSKILEESEKQMLSQNSKQTIEESVDAENLIYSSEKKEEYISQAERVSKSLTIEAFSEKAQNILSQNRFLKRARK